MVTVPLVFNILPCNILYFYSLIYMPVVNVFLSIVNRRTNIREIQAITRGFDHKEPSNVSVLFF